MKQIKFFLSLAALVLACFIAAHSPAFGLFLLIVFAWAVDSPQARLCLTLSVPELLKDIVDAFKVETPEMDSFARDWSSTTAVLGTQLTGHIATLPVTGAYDPNNGGFKAAAQDVTTLVADCPIALNQFRTVTVKIGWLTGLASKNVDLYKAATANMAWALGNYVLLTVLAEAVTGNVSNLVNLSLAATNLDTFDQSIRGQANAQMMHGSDRFCFVNTPLAGALGGDDRIRSKLFFDQRNGAQGIRRWKNVAGFNWIREFPTFPAAGVNAAGLAGDSRLVQFASRPIEDINKAADEIGARKLMSFDRVDAPEAGLSLTGIGWQEGGTGDVYLSVALLFGISIGNQGGAPGSITDNAGFIIRAS